MQRKIGLSEIKVCVKGGGDLASGVAWRLHQCGFRVFMTEIDEPMAVRRKVAFCDAIYHGSTVVEGGTDTLITAELLFTDSEQPASSITYTVTSTPANGQLELTGNPGVAITSFTQAQIDAGEVVYIHDGSNTTTDSFNRSEDGGEGNKLTAQSLP